MRSNGWKVAEMLVDKIFSRKLHEYKDVCCLMRSAFPKNEQIPMWMLRMLAFRKSANFRAFYEDDPFCGVLYTAEDNKYIFTVFLNSTQILIRVVQLFFFCWYHKTIK